MKPDRYFSTQNFDSTFRWASPEILDVTGYSHEEIIGRNPYDFFHPDDLSTIVRKHMNGVGLGDDNSIQKLTYRFRRKDNTFVWCQVLMVSYQGGLVCITRKLKWIEVIIWRLLMINP